MTMLSNGTFQEQVGLSDEALREASETPVGDLPGLSPGLCECLAHRGIRTLGELARCDENQFLTMPDFGPAKVEKMKAALSYFARGETTGTLAKQIDLPEEKMQEVRDIQVQDLPGISVCLADLLAHWGIHTVAELASCKNGDLLAVSHLGSGRLEQLKGAITRLAVGGHRRSLGEQVGLSEESLRGMSGTAIGDLPGLSRRALNPLTRQRIETVGRLACCNDDELLRIPTFGVTCLDNVKSALRRFAAGERSPAPLARPALTERGLLSEKGRLLAAWLQSQPSLPREMSLQEIGSAIGLSRERVRQLLNKLGVSERKRRPLHIMLTKRRGSANLEVMTPLGEFVRSLRKAQGLTLDKLAQRSGITLRSIQAIETGDSLLPRPETLQALARGFGIDVSVLAVKVYEAPPLPSKEETAPVR
jgi:DNA-directed RNA polymerase alpha subunit/DNA-binding XRE family transcriptional regulator